MKIGTYSLLALTVVSALTACTMSTPVMSTGGGVYTVSQSGTTGFTPLGVLRAGAYGKANTFAAASGGTAEIVSVNETPAGFAVWPQVEVKFRVTKGAEAPASSPPSSRQ
jgi:hypothetical protein